MTYTTTTATWGGELAEGYMADDYEDVRSFLDTNLFVPAVLPARAPAV